jgi:hypothetical protein
MAKKRSGSLPDTIRADQSHARARITLDPQFALPYSLPGGCYTLLPILG